MLASRRLLLLGALAAVAPTLAAGCANDDEGYLRAQGAAVAVLPDGTETGFDFPNDVRLDDDRIAPADGRLAGHCTIGRGGEGEHDVLDVAIVRTGEPAEDDLGIRSLTVHLDDPATGSLTAELAGATFSAESGATCSVSRPYVETRDGLAAVMADCTVADPDGRTAQLIVDLQFVGCDLQ